MIYASYDYEGYETTGEPRHYAALLRCRERQDDVVGSSPQIPLPQPQLAAMPPPILFFTLIDIAYAAILMPITPC